jgi:hypothetical protein
MEIKITQTVQGRIQKVSHGYDQGCPWITGPLPGQEIDGNRSGGQEDRLKNNQGCRILMECINWRQQIVEGLKMVAEMIKGYPQSDAGITGVEQCVEGLMLPAQVEGIGVKRMMSEYSINTEENSISQGKEDKQRNAEMIR